MSFLHRPTLIVLGMMCVAILLLSGCNAARGIGQDLERASQQVENAAQ